MFQLNNLHQDNAVINADRKTMNNEMCKSSDVRNTYPNRWQLLYTISITIIVLNLKYLLTLFPNLSPLLKVDFNCLSNLLILDIL